MNVIILNADYSYLDTVHWTKAARLLWLGLAEGAQVIGDKILPIKVVGTVAEDFLVPMIIVLKKFIRKIFKKQVPWKKGNVFIRDGYRCQYCRKRLSTSKATIDHVKPVSQGGKNTFENTVTCCKVCNQKKGDRTVREAGLSLRKSPVQPTIAELLQSTTGIKGVKATLQEYGLA